VLETWKTFQVYLRKQKKKKKKTKHDETVFNLQSFDFNFQHLRLKIFSSSDDQEEEKRREASLFPDGE
jgi:hypothetical protein